MTALNVILRPDAAYLVTDGLVTEVGKAPFCVPKVLPLPHLNAALGARGCIPMLPLLYNRIVYNRRTFEDAAANLGTDLRDVLEDMRRVAPDLPTHDVVLVGWPENRPGPECWLVVDHEKWGPPAFEAVRTEAVISPPAASLADRLEGRNIVDPVVPFYPDADAIKLIEAQTAVSPGYVGAFAQLTIVRRGHIETRVHKFDEHQGPVEAPPTPREQLFRDMA